MQYGYRAAAVDISAASLLQACSKILLS